MPTGVLLICASVLLAGPLIGQESGVIELQALHPLAADEAVEIQLVTGPLPRGARLEVMTEQGELLGTVRSLGIPNAPRGETATIPVPRAALVEGRLRLRMQIVQSGAAARPPQPSEIRQVNLVTVPASR
ncbi:hypothetical protein [Bradyrhizobium diazoefficiens]|uniref:hypothetical protein n=1 Tax=Bradyrhizobium diazoefficiens TaxID=1355477 RepID=UPI0011AE1E59|nr:hypothetical protein [Bradyrhizobium diazoefficiens]MBR0868223.1 hypothetical protein [Bradyrhizobium diazoefficiens]MBR0892689.1 hypothetical protein [Bradyrhizobium diazoefficiens]